jgi:membrane-associated phospholipid phosphatase
VAGTRFVSRPAPEEVPALAILTISFALTFAVLYGLGSALSAFVPWRLSVALPLDAGLPFWPGAAAVYLTILPVLMLAPFALRDLASLLPLFAALMLETGIAFVFFILLPVDPPAITCCDQPLTSAVFGIADAINLDRNYLPSLHVAFAFTAAAAFAPRAGRIGAALLFLWASAVAASTLLTRQHFVIDVIAGIVLAFLCWRLATQWARRPDIVSAVDIDLLCLRNFERFSRRHRRYLGISILVIASGIPHWRRQRLARAGFAFLQSMDDILDGDRVIDREPLEVADEMIAGLQSGRFADHELARLGAAFRAALLARAGEPAVSTAIALLRAMRRDRERVLAGEVLDREALRAQHRATFTPSIDLLLLAADSTLTARDVPELIDAFGWCSTVRDLDEDLRHRLINVPLDVYQRAMSERPMMMLDDLPRTQAMHDWLAEESARAARLLARSQERIAAFGEQRGAALLRRFANSMRLYL